MSDWQPIETAPKDTAILVYHNGFTVCHWNMVYERWVVYGADTDCTRALNLDPWKPTHWMPLPDPPKGQSNE